MTDRTRRQQRGVLLSFLGVTVGFLITLAFRVVGFWEVHWSVIGGWYVATAVVHVGLWIVPTLGWRLYFKWDPHYLYLPWGAIVLMLSVFVYVLPEARYLIQYGFFVNLLFVVGLAGFRETLIFSGLMAGGYLTAIFAAASRDESLLLGYEAMFAGLIFALGTFAGTVLERAKRFRNERVATSEQVRKLSLAVDQSPSLLIITDTKGRIEYVNPKFTRTTGYSLEELRGETPRVLRSDETPPELYQDLWETISAGEVWQGELKNIKKNGEPYWVISSISPLRNREGVTTHYLGVQEDVTDRKQVEAKLFQAQKMESVGQLVSGVAHDFNNLLTGVLGFTELALAKVDDSDSLKSDLLEIRKAGESASALTQQLLAFGRQQMLRPIVLDLNDVLRSVETLLRRTIKESVLLTMELEEDLGLVRADPAQIQQILVNLAVNARDAMPDGGGLVIATANAELGSQFANEHVVVRPGRYVMLTVSDSGRGMAEETRKRVFEPFFTTKERGRGTGLGLATVYGIVKQSRGYIWVFSEPGQGCTFKIFLPRVAEVLEELELREPSASQLSGAESILLVEDDNVVRTLARSILEGRGYRVLAAENAGVALEMWRDDAIDLLITDVVMPGMNGVELADYLQARKPDLRVLLVSGYAEQTIIEDKLADPRTPFIGKPFKVDDFLAKVREVLEG